MKVNGDYAIIASLEDISFINGLAVDGFADDRVRAGYRNRAKRSADIVVAGNSLPNSPVRPLCAAGSLPNHTASPASGAASFPCGFTQEGLPVGLQLIGPRYSEARLLSIAAAYEEATDWHLRRPALPPG